MIENKNDLKLVLSNILHDCYDCSDKEEVEWLQGQKLIMKSYRPSKNGSVSSGKIFLTLRGAKQLAAL